MKKFFILITLIFLIFLALLTFGGNISQEIWPTSGWEKSTCSEQNLDCTFLDFLDKKIASAEYGYVDSMLIIRNGYIVYEKSYEHDYFKINYGKDSSPSLYNYFNPVYHPFYKETRLHTLQSVTKSVTSALIGIAIGRGEITGVEAKVLDFFDKAEVENLDERKRRMTLEDLLTMRAGIEWNESTSYTDPQNSCTQMEGSEDWIKFVINRRMEVAPGTRFEYNSGASQLLSFIIKKSTGLHVNEYAEKYLFLPLGIKNYEWKVTPTGYPDTEGGLYLEPRDLAKIGFLYLKDGIWEGKKILPEGWVKKSVSPHVEDTTPEDEARNWAYGYQWWLIPYREEPLRYVYTCLGYGGQYMFVAPEYELIAVFTGWNIEGERRLPVEVFFDYVLKAVKNKK